MDAMVLLRGPNLSVDEFRREALERRGLVHPRDARIVRTFALADGVVAVDLLGPFDGLRQRPAWSTVQLLAHVLGDAFGAHDDPRGFFVFPYDAPGATSYEGLVAERSEGIWIERNPAYPNCAVADFQQLKEEHRRSDDAAHRRLCGLPDAE